MKPKYSELTPAQEFRRCRDKFALFLRHVKIEDAETKETVPLKLWPPQIAVTKMLDRGDWIIGLKARRLGFTTLLAARAVWKTLRKNRRVFVFFQDKEYAEDFIENCRFIHDCLPDCLRLTPTLDNRRQLYFNKNGHGSEIRALAPTKRAGRSFAADLMIFDEAAYIELLAKILRAAKPSLETKGGQAVVVSTSNGTQGHFHELWNLASAGKSRFKPIFFPWTARPGRTPEWYAKEAKENADDPLYMKREYPATAEEAFESATGRVYALFSAHGESGKKFVRALPPRPEWKHYRAIDFGGVDPFVCLWACVVPGDPPGLTISPSCPHTIREMLAYSFGDNGRPKDEDNHAPDALRYMVITPGGGGIRGHLHVYRELYIPNSARMGLSLPDLARKIRDCSGDQHFEHTIADRSRPDSITLLSQLGIPTIPARALRGERGGEIEQGITRVNALITAQAKGSADALPEIKTPRAPAQSFDATRWQNRKAIFV